MAAMQRGFTVDVETRYPKGEPAPDADERGNDAQLMVDERRPAFIRQKGDAAEGFSRPHRYDHDTLPNDPPHAFDINEVDGRRTPTA